MCYGAHTVPLGLVSLSLWSAMTTGPCNLPTHDASPHLPKSTM